MTAIQPLDADVALHRAPAQKHACERPRWYINMLLGKQSRLCHSRKAKLMKAICGSDRMLSNVSSTTLLWSEQVLVHKAQRKWLGGS